VYAYVCRACMCVVRAGACAFAHVLEFVHAHVCMRVRVREHACALACLWLYACVGACVHVRMHLRACV
jgi:hypothetical protein